MDDEDFTLPKGDDDSDEEISSSIGVEEPEGEEDGNPDTASKSKGRRLTPVEFTQAKALWETGSWTLAQLSAKFGISIMAMHTRLKRAGAKKGAKFEAIPSRINTEVAYQAAAQATRTCSAPKPDVLRGVGLNFVVLDEVQDMKPNTFSKVIRQTLSSTRGRPRRTGARPHPGQGASAPAAVEAIPLPGDRRARHHVHLP